ncbi:MAG: hypothetical protein IT245_02260 [Bacteroidia bacterium]|nr:hypothetical protein [Bacteroidia bacterium]
MNVEYQLKAILTKVLEEHPNVFLVEAHHGNNTYEFVIDGDQPLGIYDISEIGRAINHIADETMPEENYTLDVLSPGADSDIKLLRQYPKHIGREFQVILSDESSFKGHLRAVDGNQLNFEYFENTKPKKNEMPITRTVDFENIKKAHIILSFK